MKQILIVLFFVMLSILLSDNVYAVNYDRLVTCSTNTCTISSNDPLFNELNWLPGSEVIKTIRVKNTKTTPLTIYTRADKNISSSNLGDVIGIKITDQSSQTIRLDTTLTQFFNSGLVELGKVNGNSEKDFLFDADLIKETNNTYQNKQTTFSLTFNFSCAPLLTPTPTIRPTPTKKPTPSPKSTYTPTPTPKPHPYQPPKFEFWWFRYFQEWLRNQQR
jgi:hypothetical protein